MRLRPLAPLLLLFVAAGCVGADPLFVASQRATHDALSPPHRQYVENDPDLTAEEKTRKLRLLDLWERDIAAQENELKSRGGPFGG